MSTQYVVGDQPVPGSGYRLARFLGRGGFGEVWKATAPGGAEAALKIIRFGGREGRKEFRALQLVKRIHHTHLVPIIAFWVKNEKGEILDDDAVRLAERPEQALTSTADVPTATLASLAATGALEGPGELIIAMGLGEQSLFDRLEQCRQEGLPGIPDDELFRYMEDSAEAIDFLNRPLHDLGAGPTGIQHCDIKPHNLIIVGGSVQVCDFGLARMMQGDRATTAAASIAYAAPECLVEGKPSDTTDQYCLAVTFAELKTGQLPYQDLTMAAVMDAKRQEKLDYSGFPKATQAVLRRATASDPKKRYASCAEMVHLLRESLAEPDHARQNAAGKAGLRFTAVALVLAIAAGGGWWAWQHYGPQNEKLPVPAGPNAVQPAPIPLGPSKVAAASNTTVSTNVAPAPPDKTLATNRDGMAYLASGTEALKKQDFKTAVADLTRAGKLMPRNPSVFSRLGAACMAQQQWKEAIEAYTAAIGIEPYDNDYLRRGQAYLELKERDKAIDDFTAAAQKNRDNVAAYVALGDAFPNDGEQALGYYSKALAACARDPGASIPEWDVRLLRANTYLMQGNKAEAANDLTHALARAPRGDEKIAETIVVSLEALADAYSAAHQFDEAEKWEARAVQLTPDEAAKEACRQRLATFHEAAKSAQSNHPSP